MEATQSKVKVRTPFQEFLVKFKKQKTAILGLIVLIAILLLSFTGETWLPYEVNEYDYAATLQEPSPDHLLGTDEFGRDIFTRIILGAKISIGIGLGAVTVGAFFGIIFGLLAGYYGGWIDNVISKIGDVLFAFPGTILAIAIIAILGSGIGNVIIAVAIFSMPSFTRLVRSTTISVKNSVYVQAARSIGDSDLRIMIKHILPSALPNVIVYYTMNIGSAILTASSLSFLGMGAQAPSPEWGLQLSTGRTYIGQNWHMTLFPGLAIFIAVLSFNLLGDGLRDALDPKTNR